MTKAHQALENEGWTGVLSKAESMTKQVITNYLSGLIPEKLARHGKSPHIAPGSTPITSSEKGT